MDGAYRIDLVVRTPEGSPLRRPVAALRFPGADGSVGIYPRHAPLMSVVTCGLLVLRRVDGSREDFAVGEGFIEVHPGSATLLVEFLHGPDDIDTDRAHAAMERASGRLRRRDPAIDTARAEAALCRAIMRLKACGCGCSRCERPR